MLTGNMPLRCEHIICESNQAQVIGVLEDQWCGDLQAWPVRYCTRTCSAIQQPLPDVERALSRDKGHESVCTMAAQVTLGLDLTITCAESVHI